MKPVLPVLAAGSSFAVLTILGLIAGVAAANRSGQPLWVLGGLAGGALLGTYAAFRLVTNALR